jgi:hypothetical protein
MLVVPVGLRSEKDYAGDARQKLKSTDPTSRQRGCPTTIDSQLSKNTQREKGEKLVEGPRWVPDTRTDWLADCR